MPDDATGDVLADLIARCPEHGNATETWPECQCAAARKAAAWLADNPPAPNPPVSGAPEPRQTRRDMSWAVMFRLARTGVWVEWSSGHREPSEAVRSAEALVPMASVEEIRFDRVLHQRDMFSLHDLATGDPDA